MKSKSIKAVSDAVTEAGMLVSKNQLPLNAHQASFHVSVLSSRSLDAEAVCGSANCFHLAVPWHGNDSLRCLLCELVTHCHCRDAKHSGKMQSSQAGRQESFP